VVLTLHSSIPVRGSMRAARMAKPQTMLTTLNSAGAKAGIR
jgi:hypothetical protein